MGNLRKSLRNLARSKKRGTMNAEEREILGMLQRTFPPWDILCALSSPAGFLMTDEIMQNGLKALADRGFVIERNPFCEADGDPLLALDVISLVEEMRRYPLDAGPSRDPVFRGFVAFLTLIDTSRELAASASDIDAQDIMFSHMWFLVSVAVSQSTSPITV